MHNFFFPHFFSGHNQMGKQQSRQKKQRNIANSNHFLIIFIVGMIIFYTSCVGDVCLDMYLQINKKKWKIVSVIRRKIKKIVEKKIK